MDGSFGRFLGGNRDILNFKQFTIKACVRNVISGNLGDRKWNGTTRTIHTTQCIVPSPPGKANLHNKNKRPAQDMYVVAVRIGFSAMNWALR